MCRYFPFCSMRPPLMHSRESIYIYIRSAAAFSRYTRARHSPVCGRAIYSHPSSVSRSRQRRLAVPTASGPVHFQEPCLFFFSLLSNGSIETIYRPFILTYSIVSLDSFMLATDGPLKKFSLTLV